MAGISDVIPMAVFQGTGSRGPFPFADGATAIPFAANAHLYALRVDAVGVSEELSLGVHYDLAVTLDSATNLYTAELSLRVDQPVLAAAAGAAPAERIALWREQPLDQSLSIGFNARLPSQSFDRLHNKLIQIGQELRQANARALKVPVYEDGPELGDALTRRGKVVAGNAATGVLEMAIVSSLTDGDGAVLLQEFNFTSIASQQDFQLSAAAIDVAAAVLVWVGGARQPSDTYTLARSGENTTLRLGAPLAAGVEVDALVLGSMAATDVGLSGAMAPVVQAITRRAGVNAIYAIAGAVADGVADDRAAIAAADALTGELVFPPGNYLVASNLTIASPTRFLPSAKLVIPTGITVTLNHAPAAPLQQIFQCSGAGKVVFSTGAQYTAYPEWWGADADGAGIDGEEILACYTAAPLTQLQRADYLLSAPLALTRTHSAIKGVAEQYTVDDVSSRLVLVSATADVLTVDNPTASSDPANFIYKNQFERLELTRSLAPTPPAFGSEITGGAGFSAHGIVYLDLENVTSSQHYIGFRIGGVIQAKFARCVALRSVEGSAETNDKYFGFWLNGAVEIGLPGGNAGIYVEDCIASIAGGVVLEDSVGLYTNANYADVYVDGFESGGFHIGVLLDGSAGGSAEDQKAGNVNVILDRLVQDSFLAAGLRIDNHANGGVIKVDGSYFAPSAAGAAVACVHVRDSVGTVLLGGSEGICWPLAGCRGLYIESASGVCSNINAWKDSTKPVELQGASNCLVADDIHNPTVTAAQAAVLLTSTTKCTIAPKIRGKVNAFLAGINLSGAGNSGNIIDVSGVDVASINGGAANILLINGVSITADGIYGGNIVRGFGTHQSSATTFASTDKVLGRVSAGGGAAEEVTFTDQAQQLCDDTSFAAMATTLGLGAADAVRHGSLFAGNGGQNIYLRQVSSINRIDSYDNPITATVALAINALTIQFNIADAAKLLLGANDLSPNTDNAYDLGTSSQRFRDIRASRDVYSASASFLHRTTAALPNGAAAAAGTITNAPAAGNPTKWIPIDDNGTTRYVPAW